MLKCRVHKCILEAGRIFVFEFMHLCLSGCIHFPRFTPREMRWGGLQSAWWSHHVVDKVFQCSYREYGEQRDDGDVPGYG